jgi:dihydrofolate reductase
MNIVVSNTIKSGDGYHVVASFDAGIRLAEEMAMSHLWVIGGNSIYTEAFTSRAIIDTIYATEIDYRYKGCDTKFPSIYLARYTERSAVIGADKGIQYRIVEYS